MKKSKNEMEFYIKEKKISEIVHLLPPLFHILLVIIGTWSIA